MTLIDFLKLYLLCVMTVGIPAYLLHITLFQKYTFAIDPNNEKCLENVHFSVLEKTPPKELAHGDYVFFKPDAKLDWVKEPYIMKKVGGIPGDHLLIKDGTILINGVEIAKGTPLRDIYYQHLSLDRNETIPPGKLFLYGTHPLSDDSRYWGYEEIAALEGKAYVLF